MKKIRLPINKNRRSNVRILVGLLHPLKISILTAVSCTLIKILDLRKIKKLAAFMKIDKIYN